MRKNLAKNVRLVGSKYSFSARHGKLSKNQLLIIFVMLVALYVIVPQLDQFTTAFESAKQANFTYIAFAGLAILVSILSSAATYKFLAFKRIKYPESALIQIANMFVNRLLPAGIGGMGLSADFLYRRGHSIAMASTVVVINNLLTSFGHLLLISFAIIFLGLNLPELDYYKYFQNFYIILLVILLVIFIIRFKYLAALNNFRKELFNSLLAYSKRKLKLIIALFFAILNTLGHVVAVSLCIYAFGVDLPFFAALVILTGGVALASITPTPGGLIGSEAGLTAVLISYGVEGGTALAIALSYRLVSYWIPLAPGMVALALAEKNKFI